MIKLSKNKKSKNIVCEEFIKCECGYSNEQRYIDIYGTCLKCGKVLNEQANFRHILYDKLKLWRYKR